MVPAGFELIDLDQPLPGYRQFLSAWLYRGAQGTYLIDPGPTSSIGDLLHDLRGRGVDRLDLVLLTHIHLDHAGGIGPLLEAYPEARVVCHPKGARHLLDPARLWAGSLHVLGEVARLYGEPAAVAPERIATWAEAEAHGLQVIETPGHAPHHLSFVLERTLIAGEVIGIHCPLPAAHREATFLRPATPPRFFLEEALGSIDRLLALRPMADWILFAHYGARRDARGLLQAGREQHQRWVDLLREMRAEDPPATAPDAAPGAQDLPGQPPAAFVERVHQRLLRDDPLYATFPQLAEEIRARERFYLGQTLEGMLGYLGRP